MPAQKKSKKAGELLSPAEAELTHLTRTLNKLDRRIEKFDERIQSLEKEISALKVWGSILSFLIPSLLLSLLLKGLQ
ncbi:MAG: hypothetical protein PWP04_1196 [Candidatus Atribacteria bacterium]|nr:hypothetical protein [Candidatus Atribacteria bacterium]